MEQSNSQSRKWTLVINNPLLIGLDHKAIVSILARFVLVYYCLCDEIGEKGTYHTHIFILSESPIRFSTIKNRFPTAHIEKAYGTAQENRDYLLKTGKWTKTNKAETSVPDTFEEWGMLPSPKEEKAPAMAQLLKDLQAGKTNTEIISENPKFGFRVKEIDLLRQTFLMEKYARETRNVQVSYVFGTTGTGKTRDLYEKYPAQEICRITTYRKDGVLFDAYHCQSVLVFEEFASQIPITAILNYLDRYPLMLPARYNDRIACYTNVVITSNRPLENQYESEQRYQIETWRAFLRRIHHIIEYKPDGSKIIHK